MKSALHTPQVFADKGANGMCTFVLLLMVLTRIPPEPGFFLPAYSALQVSMRANGNKRLKLAVVCSAKCS